jgi:hypothetical protein
VQQLLGAMNEQINMTQVIVTFALIMARIMSIVLLVPFLGGKNAPTEVKMGVGVTLTLIIWPTALSSLTGPIPLTPIGFLLMMLKETFVGLVIGFIDRDSAMGQEYLAHQNENVFYREATFYSADEVAQLLGENGFAIQAWGQTLSHPLAEIRDIEALRPGFGECAFVVISAQAMVQG